jgi:hypothetical protein
VPPTLKLLFVVETVVVPVVNPGFVPYVKLIWADDPLDFASPLIVAVVDDTEEGLNVVTVAGCGVPVIGNPTVIVSGALLDPLELVAVMEYVVAAVGELGIPVICPVVVLKFKPAGKGAFME